MSLVAGVVILTTEWTVADLALFVAALFIVRGLLQSTITVTGIWAVVAGIIQMLAGVRREAPSRDGRSRGAWMTLPTGVGFPAAE